MMSRGKVGNSQHFPTNLHILLDEAEKGNHSLIISWCSQGQAFKIVDQDALVPLLAKYFRQTKYKSFLRQLQSYDFHRTTRGCEKGVVSHPLFVRGRRSLCFRMSRKSTGAAAASQSAIPRSSTSSGNLICFQGLEPVPGNRIAPIRKAHSAPIFNNSLNGGGLRRNEAFTELSEMKNGTFENQGYPVQDNGTNHHHLMNNYLIKNVCSAPQMKRSSATAIMRSANDLDNKMPQMRRSSTTSIMTSQRRENIIKCAEIDYLLNSSSSSIFSQTGDLHRIPRESILLSIEESADRSHPQPVSSQQQVQVQPEQHHAQARQQQHQVHCQEHQVQHVQYQQPQHQVQVQHQQKTQHQVQYQQVQYQQEREPQHQIQVQQVQYQQERESQHQVQIQQVQYQQEREPQHQVQVQQVHQVQFQQDPQSQVEQVYFQHQVVDQVKQLKLNMMKEMECDHQEDQFPSTKLQQLVQSYHICGEPQDQQQQQVECLPMQYQQLVQQQQCEQQDHHHSQHPHLLRQQEQVHQPQQVEHNQVQHDRFGSTQPSTTDGSYLGSCFHLGSTVYSQRPRPSPNSKTMMKSATSAVYTVPSDDFDLSFSTKKFETGVEGKVDNRSIPTLKFSTSYQSRDVNTTATASSPSFSSATATKTIGELISSNILASTMPPPSGTGGNRTNLQLTTATNSTAVPQKTYAVEPTSFAPQHHVGCSTTTYPAHHGYTHNHWGSAETTTPATSANIDAGTVDYLLQYGGSGCDEWEIRPEEFAESHNYYGLLNNTETVDSAVTNPCLSHQQVQVHCSSSPS